MRRAIRIITGLVIAAQGVAKLATQLVSEDEAQPTELQHSHDHSDSRAMHEAALSWARTVLGQASYSHKQYGVTSAQVQMMADAAEELDHCFAAQSAGAVLLTSWLVQALAEATYLDPEQLYESIRLQLAQVGTVESGES